MRATAEEKAPRAKPITEPGQHDQAREDETKPPVERRRITETPRKKGVWGMISLF